MQYEQEMKRQETYTSVEAQFKAAQKAHDNWRAQQKRVR